MGSKYTWGVMAALPVVGVLYLSGGTLEPRVAEAAPSASAVTPVQELPEGVTPAMLEEGKVAFQGSGLCMTCHGAEGEGTPIGPTLTSGEWIHVDGSFPEILELIETGVPQPTQYMVPMAARGGGGLSDDETRAVAAYVWSISRERQ